MPFMFRNYFKTAWRHLLHSKFYSLINIAGLAVGLAVGIMILLWAEDELSFDRSYPQSNQLYQVCAHIGTGSSAQVWGTTPAPLAVYARHSMPGVIGVVRVEGRGSLSFSLGDKKIAGNSSAFTDPSFFSVFGIPLLEGDKNRPFNGANSMVITTSTARKFFGDKDALGKTLSVDKEAFVVTGLIADLPENSSVHYDAIFPMDYAAKQFTARGGNGAWKTIDEDMGNYMYSIYLRLKDNASPATVAKGLTDSYWQHRPGDNPNGGYFALQSLPSLHLVAMDGNSSALQLVRIFLLIAVLILAIACINYVNLTTARAMLRSREVSMRKIIGATRLQLFIQLVLESTVLFTLATLLAFCLIWLLLPLYNSLSGKHLLFSLANGNVWLVVVGAVISTLLMASIYPALLLSSFRPIQALSGKLSLGLANISFRKGLVVLQFVFSTGLIVGTLIIGLQLKFIRDKDLGMDKEHVFSFPQNRGLHDHYDAVRQELLRQPGVLGVAGFNSGVAGADNTTGDTWWEGKPANTLFLIHPYGVDQNLIPLLKIQLVAGTNFTGSKADSAHLILNETAVLKAGIKDPIGKRFDLWETHGTIIGVVKDFNYASLHKAIEPAVFYFEPAGWSFYVKADGRAIPEALAAAERIYKSYPSDYPFSYTFLDEEFSRMYKSDQQLGILFSVFAIVAVLISCLGLLGLATYTTQVKTREIGIRKVLGASTMGISSLLARDFLWLVLIAFAIATPVIWWAMRRWLQDYVYRIQIPWWPFLLTGGMVVGIALLTVGFQAVRAAMANPVNNLRSE
ncbi:MAG TPA: ABC transporter permease [Puia sp.]|nr:ABC transporter permease [Puia sp.]